MLTVYDAADGVLIKRDGPAPITSRAVWIDLLNPTKDEDLLVEQALSISVPTREEMSEIEASSRLYQEGGAHYMTAVVLHQPDPPFEPPVATPITFILAGNRLVTVRYAEPRAFPIFISRAQKKDAACMTGAAVMVGPARGHHRPRGRPGGAHPGRGRQAVAGHLRRQGRRAARARAASTSRSA